MEGYGSTSLPVWIRNNKLQRGRDLNKLEKSQNIIGRWDRGAPSCMAVKALRGEMG